MLTCGAFRLGPPHLLLPRSWCFLLSPLTRSWTPDPPQGCTCPGFVVAPCAVPAGHATAGHGAMPPTRASWLPSHAASPGRVTRSPAGIGSRDASLPPAYEPTQSKTNRDGVEYPRERRHQEPVKARRHVVKQGHKGEQVHQSLELLLAPPLEIELRMRRVAATPPRMVHHHVTRPPDGE
jgi:hypothetical protein